MVKLLSLLLFILSTLVAYASDVTVPAAIKPSGTAVVVAAGPGDQMDPHVSGKLVVYTSYADPMPRIHYFNLADSSDNTIPGEDGLWDSLPEVSGQTIVFRRARVGMQEICAFDLISKTTTVLDPPVDGSDTYRVFPRIGGRTVAWQERFAGFGHDDMVVFDLDTNVATRLTYDDEGADMFASVSPDGATVVWTKTLSSGNSEVWQATRNPDGSWTTMQILTDAAFVFAKPVTNGEMIAYVTTHEDDGYETDIRLQPVGGGPETRILMRGLKSDVRMSGHAIVFTNWLWPGNPDVYVYDIDTNGLYQITDTAEQFERFDDLSVDAAGNAIVVWNTATGADVLDVLAFTFHLGPAYTVRPLFDQQRSYKFGGVAPIKLQLLDAAGNNLSSGGLSVVATAVVPVASSTPADVVDAGNANPDANFRYDATLGGYIFNLSTRNLAPGTWELRFTIGGDSVPYAIRFSLR